MRVLKTYKELNENVIDPRFKIFLKRLDNWFVYIDNIFVKYDNVDESYDLTIVDEIDSAYFDIYHIVGFSSYINAFFKEYDHCMFVNASVIEEYKELHEILKGFIEKYYSDYYSDYLEDKKRKKFNL